MPDGSRGCWRRSERAVVHFVCRAEDGIRDLTVTGVQTCALPILEKGGIYNHFSSKEQLALEAFDYAYGLVEQRVRQALAGKLNAIERLLALVSVFEGIVEDPPVAGGCPILNTAIEADDANEALRERARAAMDSWRTTIHRIVNKGIERQEIRPGVDGDEVASILIATLEGAIMLSNLYKDPRHMQRAADHIAQDRKSTRLNSSHSQISYAVVC